jgi:hypothetical protein
VAELPNDGDADAVRTTEDKYDKTIYKITATLNEDESQRTTLLGITFKHYTISNPYGDAHHDSGQEIANRAVPIILRTTMFLTQLTSFTLSKDGDTTAMLHSRTH